MTTKEFMVMASYLAEANEALKLIVNRPELAGLGGKGDVVFRETIEEIDWFVKTMNKKYGRFLFNHHSGPSPEIDELQAKHGNVIMIPPEPPVN